MRHGQKAVQYGAIKETVTNSINNLFDNMQANMDYSANKNAQSDSFIRALADGDYDEYSLGVTA